ncbi:MAG TPA: DUF5715 family protein [Gemmatimonadaceae bacterium]|jgi:hypothetical protein
MRISFSSASPATVAPSSPAFARALRPSSSFLGTLATAALLLCSFALSVAAQSLRGSHRSVKRTYRYATTHDLPFSHSSRDVKRALHEGYLVRLSGSSNFVLHEVSFPYVTRTTLTFVRRLSAQYRRGCGEKLVITSAVRPESMQPGNSSEFSVHPVGIAVDIRKPEKASCLRWLRKNLLIIEEQGVIDATEEHHPAHFHVAVYPAAYKEYLASR